MDKLGLGRKMEQAVMRRWEWYGFRTWQPARAKYATQDLFGLFDFIAVKPYCPVNLVQVKRKRREEAERALEAIKSFTELYHAPIAPFVVLWHQERVADGNCSGKPCDDQGDCEHCGMADGKTNVIVFEAWELGLLGWMQAEQWSEKA